MEPNYEKLQEIYGRTFDFVTPSGLALVIREQTGEDDDILSGAKDATDASSSNKFIAGIVVHAHHTDNGKFNLDDALNHKLCDKYAIMIASRIFSLGNICKLTYEWPDGFEGEYEEDLALYIWDYYDENKPFPVPGDEAYFKYRIKPHPHGPERARVFKLKNGKIVRYQFMTGHGEKFLMGLPDDKQSINAELLARKIELKIKDNWAQVQNFKTFTALEMGEIRHDVEENDPGVSLLSDFEHPTTKQVISFPIVGNPDFFFPREI